MPNQPDRNSHAQIDKAPSNGKSHIRWCKRRFVQCRIPVEYGLRLKIRSSTAYTKQMSMAISMGIIFFIRRIISIYTMINKPISGFVAETEHFSHTGI